MADEVVDRTNIDAAERFTNDLKTNGNRAVTENGKACKPTNVQPRKISDVKINRNLIQQKHTNTR
jgi:hypothetical protein